MVRTVFTVIAVVCWRPPVRLPWTPRTATAFDRVVPLLRASHHHAHLLIQKRQPVGLRVPHMQKHATILQLVDAEKREASS